MIRQGRLVVLIAMTAALLTACNSLSDQDRALIQQAAQKADTAKLMAEQANATSQQALQAATAASAASTKAETDAAAAKQEADRVTPKPKEKKGTCTNSC